MGVNIASKGSGPGRRLAWRDRWSDAVRYLLSRALLTIWVIVRDRLLSHKVAWRGGCSSLDESRTRTSARH
jgi:hypothetical protein